MFKITSTQTFDFKVNGKLTLHISPEGVEVDIPTANILKERFGSLVTLIEESDSPVQNNQEPAPAEQKVEETIETKPETNEN